MADFIVAVDQHFVKNLDYEPSYPSLPISRRKKYAILLAMEKTKLKFLFFSDGVFFMYFFLEVGCFLLELKEMSGFFFSFRYWVFLAVSFTFSLLLPMAAAISGS